VLPSLDPSTGLLPLGRHVCTAAEVEGMFVKADAFSALDYKAAAKAVIAAVEGSEYFTVEALTTQIARIVVCDQRAPWVRVRVRKPGALRFADTVGLVLERTQADFAAAGSPS
jgi:hypothetical protein